MSSLRLYIVLSAVCLLIFEKFFGIFRRADSFWLAPLIFISVIILLYILQFATFGIMVLSTNLKKEAGKHETFFRFLLKDTLAFILLFSKAKIKAEGIEKLPENRHFLFVCNHQFDTDPVIMLALFKNAKLSFIGKKEIYEERPFFAKIMHRLSCLPVDRENDREAVKTIVTAIKYLKEDRSSIGLFPEGYSSKDRNLQPFRNGSLKIALKSKAPVAVCVIDSPIDFPKKLFKTKTTVDFRLLEIIYPETYENMNTAELGDMIHKKMESALAEIRENKG